jgi:methylmalonyl-CoA/ethylmalonyl-CoA epimerase
MHSDKQKLMKNLNHTLATLELAQIGWVVPDIHASVQFFTNSLRTNFPPVLHIQANELSMTYYGKIVEGEWLTTQAYNGGTFIELIQPLSGQSMFRDYLTSHPDGGIQHTAFRLPVGDFDRITREMSEQGYAVISRVDHPIARMAFFDTCKTLGIVTEIMGITPEGWAAIEQMQNAG